MKQAKINKRDQRVATEILTQFMFTKDMDYVRQVWDDVYKQYDLCDDPFTYTPCTPEDYCKNRLEYEKQVAIERFGHCDWLE